MEFRTVARVAELGRGAFESFDASEAFPFLSFEWFDALERSAVVGKETGWTPRHLVVEEQGRALGFVPAYEKEHSMGEFVFDHAIAEFSENRLGVPYYPKLIVAVPFTPATGPRLLFERTLETARRMEVGREVAKRLVESAEAAGLSSVHVLFPDDVQLSYFATSEWSQRVGIQFQFSRRQERNFEDYLGRFNAKRRAAIRRERRETAHLHFDSLSGASLTAALAGDRLLPRRVFELYLTTVDKYVWGRRYLNEEFFDLVLRTMPERIHLLLVRPREGEPPIAMAFNLLGRDALYGRYWGAHVEVPFLHFEACLYRGIDEALSRGLSRFEPGAGGEHKESRGFEPTVTHSSSYFRDRRVAAVTRDFYLREREALLSHHAITLRP